MKSKRLIVFLCGVLLMNGCASKVASNNGETTSGAGGGANPPAAGNNSTVVVSKSPDAANSKTEKTEKTESPGGAPRTVRDFFNLLPQEYFNLEGCEPETDKNCDKARREYVTTYLETEDTANGFWKSGCDGGQSCLTMALFKRPDNTYVVGVHTSNEGDDSNHFLEYKDGKWTDISAQIVPGFSDKNLYTLPRYGTTVTVYRKNYPEPNFSEIGAKLYDLIWKDGKFTIRKER